MNTLAPELSALTIILRSTGPVISTRRSAMSAGYGAQVHVAVADRPRLGQEIGQLARVELGLALRAASEQLVAATAEARCRLAANATASGVRISAYSAVMRPVISIPAP